MSEPKKKLDEPKAEEPKTEQPDTKHHYADKEALKQGPVSTTDALGAAAQHFS